MRAGWLVLVACGCLKTPPFAGERAGDGGTVDADPNATCLGGGTGIAPQICFAEKLPPLLLVQDSSVDTDTDCTLVVVQDGRALCVLAGISVTIGAKIRVTGSRPLVLWSTTDLSVSGVLDVAGHAASTGAGHDPSCVAGPGAQDDSGGGGAGASFGGIGGRGGSGNAGGSGGGAPNASAVVTTIRGGCTGGAGGAVVGGGRGGTGGGAVYMLAKDRIDVDGTINASGAPGTALGTRAGGGGGGSGGLIGFEAPTLVFANSARVFALGGGGASGGSDSGMGVAGSEPTAPDQPGSGGPSGSGGSGGAGSSMASSTGEDGGDSLVMDAAGGGGGGASGLIVMVGVAMVAGQFAPLPIMN